MDCREARDLMSDYLEQDLTDNEVRLMEEHLVGCSTCRMELADLDYTLKVVHGLPRQEPAVDLWKQFAPKFAEICPELRPGFMGQIRLYFSDLVSSVREGWEIFTATMRYNLYGSVERTS